MKNIIKHQRTGAQRQQATSAAIASVRAEGLEPSSSTRRRLAQYAKGNIPLQQLQQETLAEVRNSGTRITTR